METEHGEQEGNFEATEILLGLVLVLTSCAFEKEREIILAVAFTFLFDGLQVWPAIKEIAHSFHKSSAHPRE